MIDSVLVGVFFGVTVAVFLSLFDAVFSFILHGIKLKMLKGIAWQRWIYEKWQVSVWRNEAEGLERKLDEAQARIRELEWEVTL